MNSKDSEELRPTQARPGERIIEQWKLYQKNTRAET